METVRNIATTDADKDRVPGYMNVVASKCPRCRRGHMFEVNNPYKLKTTMRMYKECPVCKQPFELETGFYFGAGYVSYALSVALSVATLVAWWVFIGLGINDDRWLYWLAFNAVFLICIQPVLMRMSRSIWLSFFVKYDRKWYENAPSRVKKKGT
ncbi:DUF983 domain-containing protein [Niabella ginsenosidivorans]|uniref:DUF983 domain-containing protein n=1 Tax=Niabella ginsenosidivorans TaxID=1176587 RepID=A0A1A9I5P4_9BACT|nr:DUF983 domain-containing protein [Niabella ginsenosidivorans]ANH81991.1 DUF983 domain-containing protein [Niabella ginsenosidivorans]